MIDLLNFPDEILCKIFEYLSPFDALYSFLNLNNRFNHLLIPFKPQIDLTHLSYQQCSYYFNILLPTINQDESLHGIKLGNKRTPGQIQLFNTLISDQNYRNYFNNIDKILIEFPRLDELTHFVNPFLLSLTKLITLSIKIDYIRDEHFQDLTKLIINSILSITTLVKLSIEIPTGLVLAHLSDTIMFNSLIHVTLNLTLVTDLLILIQRIPNVEKLFVCLTWWTSGDRTLVKMLDEMGLNTSRTSFLNHLKKFHLTIHSIVTFQFQHFEQVLYRILNNQTTDSLTFILRNCSKNNNEEMKLIDGQQWKNLLSSYTSLIQFDLVIRINGCLESEEERSKLNSFQSKYFLEKKWLFSYLKYSIRNNTILYSIPYKTKESFDLLINNNEIPKNLPINYTSILSIDATNNEEYQLILPHFPYLQELHLTHFNNDSVIINPLNIPSLYTLKIIAGKQYINLSNLLQLLPLINTLFISYFAICDQNNSLDIYQYNRIIELSLIHIPAGNMNQVLIFLNQFPNLRFLHIHINNRRMNDEDLLTNLNEIIEKFHSLTCLELQLEKNIDSSRNWNDAFNSRVKMHITDVIFEGVLMHFWF